MKTILVAISGGIAAYKAADVISGLKANGFKVRVITTKNALDFVTPTVLGAISDGNYVTDGDVNIIAHIEEAKNCDAFVCVPATANIIAKFANGIADEFVSTTFSALPNNTPKIICPAMNTQMFKSTPVIENLIRLHDKLNCHIIEPAVGLLACGDTGIGKLPKPRKIVGEIVEILDDREPWEWPLDLDPIDSSNDSYSYMHIDLTKEVEVPLYPHVGAFGVKRRHDMHRGVDLYAPVGTVVLAVEDGIIQMVRPWTGKIADCDWWENTWAVLVKGESGLVVYGEIQPIPEISEFFKEYEMGVMPISKGDPIGVVLKVLKKDKGRPTSMLHLELRKPGCFKNIDKEWEEGKIPEGIFDPTPFLVRSIRNFGK